jgi:hypothetical protein
MITVGTTVVSGSPINGGGGGGAPSGTGVVTVTSGVFDAPSSTDDVVMSGLSGLVGGVLGESLIGDGAGSVQQTSADVSGFLAAADADAARAAIGAGQGPPHLSLGTAFNSGTSASAYLDVTGTPSAAPLFGPGESLVYLFFPVALPAGGVIMACHQDAGSTSRGWEIRCGQNGGDLGLLNMYLFTGAGVFDLPGATFTGALNAPHVLAVAMTSGGQIRFSWDGVLQTPFTPAGAYPPPIAGDLFLIGSRPGGNYPSTNIQPIQLRAYSTVLSDADLVAVAATRAAFLLADPASGTLTVDIAASNVIGFDTVLDRADTSRRWRINGALKAQEQL